MTWQFSIDRGGTFTDIIARSPDGALVTRKLLSENAQLYADAAVAGIRDILREHEGIAADAPFPAARIGAIRIGTTVATNALLTRTGATTVLAITEGFADALRIGTQNRPRLFDLHIVLPEMLYAEVVEVPERMDAHGHVLRPLDEAAARARLTAAYDAGCRAVAIVLMHGYRHAAHELRVAAIAGEIGFMQISISHRTSPLMKLVGRGDTTVADAYLSPLLRHYVEQVAAEVAGARLLFMQSHGGLAAADHFHGKDAVLSGPAGGVVGAAEIARAAGFHDIIGFDMGGTSTDVCHVSGGDFERSFETVIAGVRLRAPMMRVHTVAAGGGSILKFDGLRFRVGPESAGANPGPACYGRGGPLTVTDANVLLGRIQATHFPHVFGASGEQALDVDVVREKFAALAQDVHALTGQRRAAADLAEGFLAIAVDNMARAIRRISVERGHDVAGYTLVCFGGAGGQHACAVADALGIARVLIHPLAGVLSAYGIGLASLRVIKDRTVEAPLDAANVPQIDAILRGLAQEAVRALVAQGASESDITAKYRVHLRYAGTDTALAVAYAPLEQLIDAFGEAHRAQFGFVMKDRGLVCEIVEVEGIGATAPMTADARLAKVAGAPRAHVAVIGGGNVHQAPLYQRHALAAGQSIDGPAIIAEALATTVVDPGWAATTRGDGNLILERQRPPAAQDVSAAADPVRVEIFNNIFMSIAEQMGAVLQNTSQSVNIKERLDFSCAVFDGAANLIANAPHIPVHLGSMGDSVRAVVARHRDMADGDVFILNNPFDGGTHLPDITVVTPVFLEGEAAPAFFIASRGHHADIGGTTPGSMPPLSRALNEEGILLDNLVLVRNGVFQDEVIRAALTAGPYPSRAPETNLADLRAQVAANAKGVMELRQLVARYGRGVVRAYMGHVQDHAAEAVRRALVRLSSGHFECPMDDGGRICVAVTIDRTNRAAKVDFTGTSPQRPNNFNAPAAICRAAVLYVFRTLVADDIPMNEGVMRPITLVIPAGSMLNPKYPAAVVAGNVETSQIICDALYGALGILAACQGTMNNFTFGNDRHQYYETICGGAGAGADFDGTSAVHTHMTNSRLTDPEVLEWRFPVRIESFGIRRGSGGGGKHRGGDGVVRMIAFNEPMTAAILASRRTTRPFGLAGGGDGQPGETVLHRADGTHERLAATAEVAVNAGDAIVIATPGGGGFGKV